ncbi:MAG: BamA/TamA family outer membrane protein [Marinilabiliales bacterium]|nr:BamA/TamA family outer membrane protein [Marinilabiliales bacterium]
MFNLYETWNILSPKERDGGMNNYLKLGLVYDTRDNEACPMKGLWSEAIFIVAPGFIGDGDYSYLRLAINHRQYFSLIKDDLSFAYRIGYLGTIAGRKGALLRPSLPDQFVCAYHDHRRSRGLADGTRDPAEPRGGRRILRS